MTLRNINMLEAKRRKIHSTLTSIVFFSAFTLNDHLHPSTLSRSLFLNKQKTMSFHFFFKSFFAFTSVLLFCRKVLWGLFVFFFQYTETVDTLFVQAILK